MAGFLAGVPRGQWPVGRMTLHFGAGPRGRPKISAGSPRQMGGPGGSPRGEGAGQGGHCFRAWACAMVAPLCWSGHRFFAAGRIFHMDWAFLRHGKFEEHRSIDLVPLNGRNSSEEPRFQQRLWGTNSGPGRIRGGEVSDEADLKTRDQFFWFQNGSADRPGEMCSHVRSTPILAGHFFKKKLDRGGSL